MKHCNFANADFTDSQLHNSNFEYSKFIAGTFSRAKFYGDAIFTKAEINSSYFSNSEFNGDAYFNDVNISEAIYFPESIFHGDFYFQDSNVSGAIFKGAQFEGDAMFQWGKFWKVAQFKDSKFSKDADFNEAKFYGNDNIFIGAEFEKNGGLANFKGVTFGKNVTFSDSIFHKDAYFTKANFSGTQTEFDNVNFKEDVFFEDVKIGGAISLAKTKYNDMYIRFNDIAGKLNYNDEAYLKLIKNFDNQALFYDADKLYHEYRTQYRIKGWDSDKGTDKENLSLTFFNFVPWILVKSDEPFRKSIDTILDYFYAYGTEPILPFYYSILIIIIFAVAWRFIGLRKRFFGAEFQINEGKTRLKKFAKIVVNEINLEKDSLIFSVLLFLSGTRLFIDPPKLPGLLGKSRRLAGIMYILERALGALFLALLLISISKTIIRGPTI